MGSIIGVVRGDTRSLDPRLMYGFLEAKDYSADSCRVLGMLWETPIYYEIGGTFLVVPITSIIVFSGLC